MTDNEPRVLITAIKCDRCGDSSTDGLTHIYTETGEAVRKPLPMLVSASDARHSVEDCRCVKCGGSVLIATEPVATSHLVGGFEWMHAASGRGHLGEYDPATGEVVP